MLAQQALEAIAGKLPRQQAFQKFVDALCKEQQQDGTGEAPLIQAGHTVTIFADNAPILWPLCIHHKSASSIHRPGYEHLLI